MDRIRYSNKLLKFAKEKRAIHETEWDSAFRYTFPHRNSVYTFNQGSYSNAVYNLNNREELYDTTAMAGIQDLANSMMDLLMPETQRWLEAEVVNLKVGQSIPSDVKLVMDENNKRIQKNLLDGNVSLTASESLMDCIITGQGAVAFKDQDLFIDTYSIPIGNVFFLQNGCNRIDVIFREFVRKAKDIIQDWGADPKYKLSDEFKAKAVEAPEQEYTLIEGVYPFGIGKYHYSLMLGKGGGATVDMSSMSEICYQEIDKEQIPLLVYRWSKIAGDDYGDSPVRRALPDIKVLNELMKNILVFTEYQAFPSFQMPAEFFDEEIIKKYFGPGKVLPTEGELAKLDTSGDLRFAVELLNQIRFQVKEGIYSNELPPATQPNYMTREEVIARRQMFLRKIGQPALRLQKEFLEPFATSLVYRMKKKGLLEPYPKDWENKIKYKVVSAAALSRKQQEVFNEIQLFGQVIQTVGPDNAFKVVDVNKFTRKILEDSGFSNSLLRSEKELEALAKDEAEQAQLQQALQLFTQTRK